MDVGLQRQRALEVPVLEGPGVRKYEQVVSGQVDVRDREKARLDALSDNASKRLTRLDFKVLDTRTTRIVEVLRFAIGEHCCVSAFIDDIAVRPESCGQA